MLQPAVPSENTRVPGKKMIERFFLDGIDLQRGRRSVSQAVELSALIHADEAEAGLAFPDVAMARAEIAMHAAVGHRLPPARLVQRFASSEIFSSSCMMRCGGKIGLERLRFHFYYTPERGRRGQKRSPLHAPALREPREELPRIARVRATSDAKNCPGPQRMHIPAKKCFQAPANVRTRPRAQAIALGRDPVVAQRGEDQCGYFQPSRSRSAVMCATWWRPCQAYRFTRLSIDIGPSSGCRRRREKSSGAHRAQQYFPPLVQRFEQRERDFDRRIARIRQLRPEVFLVRFIVGSFSVSASFNRT